MHGDAKYSSLSERRNWHFRYRDGSIAACHIRKVGLEKSSASNRKLGPGDSLELESWEWLNLVQDSKKSALRDLRAVSDQIWSAGCAAKIILLRTQERARYSFGDG